MKIQESAENYLETILMLGHQKPYVRSIDIANELGFSKPSVSVAIYERHTALSEWLIKLGVAKETAVGDACRIEHVISAESFEAIKAHIKRNP